MKVIRRLWLVAAGFLVFYIAGAGLLLSALGADCEVHDALDGSASCNSLGEVQYAVGVVGLLPAAAAALVLVAGLVSEIVARCRGSRRK